MARQVRSILSEIADREVQDVTVRSTRSSISHTKRKAKLNRRKSPNGELSGSFVESVDDGEQYVMLDISYDKNRFAGIDIFRAVNTGSFTHLTTLPVDHKAGGMSYHDVDINDSDEYHYYSIFFDRKMRFSERSEISNVKKSFDVAKRRRPMLSLIQKRRDRRKGTTLLSVFARKPKNRGVVVKRIQAVIFQDGKEKVIGETDNPSQPIEIDGIFNKSLIGFRSFDKKGRAITVGGLDIEFLQPVDFMDFQQYFGNVAFVSKTKDERITIIAKHADINEKIEYVKVLKRNLTTCEKRYSKVDSSWSSSGFFVDHKNSSAETVLDDTNVRLDDIYEYQLIGYDLFGTVVGAVLRKVAFHFMEKEKKEEQNA